MFGPSALLNSATRHNRHSAKDADYYIQRKRVAKCALVAVLVLNALQLACGAREIEVDGYSRATADEQPVSEPRDVLLHSGNHASLRVASASQLEACTTGPCQLILRVTRPTPELLARKLRAVSGVLECTYLPHDSFLVVAYNVTKKNHSCPLRASRTRMLILCWTRARGQVDPRALLALEGVRGTLAAPSYARVAPDLHPGARAAPMRRSAAKGADRVVLHALVLPCPAAVPCRSIPAPGTKVVGCVLRAVHSRRAASGRGGGAARALAHGARGAGGRGRQRCAGGTLAPQDRG
jgi:hypothetical protein